MSDFSERREAMVKLIRGRGLRDERILAAMRKIERHRFLPEKYCLGTDPYGDHPCAIGYGQTISQPYMVAYMTELLQVERGQKVLEIGAGSAYQAAILAELGARVVSIERIPELAHEAQKILTSLGYQSVTVLAGDGYEGCEPEAPFDRIMVTCAPLRMPKKLVAQLAEGGRMVVPVGGGVQDLFIVSKHGGKVSRKKDLGVIFVPMVHGQAVEEPAP